MAIETNLISLILISSLCFFFIIVPLISVFLYLPGFA